MPLDIFLRIEDDFERNVWTMIANKVIDTKMKMDKNLAVLIRNEVIKGISGKR
jgi:hypothetical protein